MTKRARKRLRQWEQKDRERLQKPSPPWLLARLAKVLNLKM